MTSTAPRTRWMDRARAFAILAVVLCHAVEMVHPFAQQAFDASDWLQWTIRFGLFTVGRLGVPLFLGLTGALLLERDYSGEAQIRDFYRRKFWRLFVCVECWMVLYSIFLMWHHELPLDWRRLVGALTATGELQLGHLWYIPMILGMYLAIPFVARAVRGLSLRVLVPVCCVVFAFAVAVPSLNLALEVWGFARREALLDLHFLGGVYGLYIVGGWMIARKHALNAWPRWIAALCFAVCYGATVAFQLWRYHAGLGYKVWYDFAGLMLAGFFLLELFRRSEWKKTWLDKLCLYLSRRSFAIFLLHFPLQRVCWQYGWQLWLGDALLVQSAVMFALPLAASLALIALLERIPVVRRWLLYM